MRVGVSTTAVGGALDVEGLAALGAEVVELCRARSAAWRALSRRGVPAGVVLGLHAPLPYDGTLRRFEITGPDRRAMRRAFALVERTVAAAVDAGAAYVVVHLPSPRPRPAGPPAAAGSERAAVLDVGHRLGELAAAAGVPVLVENMSYHPGFGSAEDYCALFEAVPSLGMCLDLGHAHLSIHSAGAVAFARAVAPHVRSVHVYNTRSTGPGAGRHVLPDASQDEADGWMDVPRVLAAVAAGGRPDFAVLEHAGEAGDGDGRALVAAMEVVRAVPWR